MPNKLLECARFGDRFSLQKLTRSFSIVFRREECFGIAGQCPWIYPTALKLKLYLPTTPALTKTLVYERSHESRIIEKLEVQGSLDCSVDRGHAKTMLLEF